MDMQPQAALVAEAAAPEDQAPGYVIEIHVSGDGSITVGCESDSEESAEAAPGAEGAEGEAYEPMEGKPAKNIKEALTIALDIFRNDGKAGSGMNAQDEMNEGFNGPQALEAE